MTDIHDFAAQIATLETAKETLNKARDILIDIVVSDTADTIRQNAGSEWIQTDGALESQLYAMADRIARFYKL